MAVQRERITVDVVPQNAPGLDSPKAVAALNILACLIGRQIAREQFEQQLAAERKARKKRPADS